MPRSRLAYGLLDSARAGSEEARRAAAPPPAGPRAGGTPGVTEPAVSPGAGRSSAGRSPMDRSPHDRSLRPGQTPRVWLLMGHRAGDNSQVEALGEAVDWLCQIQSSEYRQWGRL